MSWDFVVDFYILSVFCERKRGGGETERCSLKLGEKPQCLKEKKKGGGVRKENPGHSMKSGVNLRSVEKK